MVISLKMANGVLGAPISHVVDCPIRRTLRPTVKMLLRYAVHASPHFEADSPLVARGARVPPIFRDAKLNDSRGAQNVAKTPFQLDANSCKPRML